MIYNLERIPYIFRRLDEKPFVDSKKIGNDLLAIVESALRRDVHCPALLEAALQGGQLLRPSAAAADVGAVSAAAAARAHHAGGGAGRVAGAVPRPARAAAPPAALLAGLRGGRVQGGRVEAGDGGHQVLVGHVRRLLVQLLLELLLLGRLLLQIPRIEKHDPSHDHSHSLTQSFGNIFCHGDANPPV